MSRARAARRCRTPRRERESLLAMRPPPRRVQSGFLRPKRARLSLLRLGARRFPRASRRRRVALRDERRLGDDAPPRRRRALGGSAAAISLAAFSRAAFAAASFAELFASAEETLDERATIVLPASLFASASIEVTAAVSGRARLFVSFAADSASASRSRSATGGSGRRHPRAAAAAAAAAAEAALSAPVRARRRASRRRSRPPRRARAAARRRRWRRRRAPGRLRGGAPRTPARHPPPRPRGARARELASAGARSERHRPPVLATSSASASSAFVCKTRRSGANVERRRRRRRGLSSRISAFASLEHLRRGGHARGRDPARGRRCGRPRARGPETGLVARGFRRRSASRGCPRGAPRAHVAPSQTKPADSTRHPRACPPPGARALSAPSPPLRAGVPAGRGPRPLGLPSIARVHPRAERWTRGGVDATEETRGQLVQTVERPKVRSPSTTRRFTACVSARPRLILPAAVDRSPRSRGHDCASITSASESDPTASARRDWLIMPRWATGFANWQVVELFSPFFCFFATESPPEALISTESGLRTPSCVAGSRGRPREDRGARLRARAANARWVSTSRTSARCDGRVDASRVFPGSNGRVKIDVRASAIEVRPDVPTRRRARARKPPVSSRLIVPCASSDHVSPSLVSPRPPRRTLWRAPCGRHGHGDSPRPRRRTRRFRKPPRRRRTRTSRCPTRRESRRARSRIPSRSTACRRWCWRAGRARVTR